MAAAALKAVEGAVLSTMMMGGFRGLMAAAALKAGQRGGNALRDGGFRGLMAAAALKGAYPTATCRHGCLGFPRPYGRGSIEGVADVERG